ncbi:MAG: HAD family hydrolase [Treponema sp.]|nr:HAD family hydrolase [Treponema sp.]
MNIFKIPEKLKTIIFDIDSTLYTNADYAFEQVDVQVRHFASIKKISCSQARSMVSDYRKEWAKAHNGQKISLANTMKAFGISIEESIEWRKTLIEPAEYLGEDKKLQETMEKLKSKYNLICVTNNPVLPAKKTLDALGILDKISDIIGLDTCGISKPAKEPFLLAAEKAKCKCEECLSVGDRYDIDLAVPLELNMGALEVEGVTDVYKLPEILI